MIRSEFVIEDNKIRSVSVVGHSGLAPSGSDVLCASVSAMTELVMNTLLEIFSAELDIEIEEEIPRIHFSLHSVPSSQAEAVQGVLTGFRLQLEDLRETYSDYLSVRTKKK